MSNCYNCKYAEVRKTQEGSIFESNYLACTNAEAFKFGPDMQDDMAAPSEGRFDEIVVGQYFGCNHWEAKTNTQGDSEGMDEAVEETENYIRNRQADPKTCKEGSFRTKQVNAEGDKVILCKDKETNKMKAQSILKKKHENWEDVEAEFLKVRDKVAELAKTGKHIPKELLDKHAELHNELNKQITEYNENCPVEKLKMMNRLDYIVKHCRNTELRQKAISLLDNLGMGIDVSQEVEKLFAEIDKKKSSKERGDNMKPEEQITNNALRGLMEELQDLVQEVDYVVPMDNMEDIQDTEIEEDTEEDIETVDPDIEEIADEIMDKIEDAVEEKIEQKQNPEEVVNDEVVNDEEVTNLEESLEPVYYYCVEDIDRRGDVFDNAEEAYEQAKEDLTKLGYEVKELDDNAQFDIISPSTGVAYPGVIYTTTTDVDESLDYKQFIRKGQYEDLQDTKQEIDKATREGKSAEEIKTIIDLNADDDKEKDAAQDYAVDKLTESLLATSKTCALKDLNK